MPSGIIVIDKPRDWTSMDVCAKLRGVLGERRIGHAGTLDPMATGVLPVFVGRATRAVEFAAGGDKEYHALLRLGEITDTQDVTGTLLERRPVSAGPAELEAALGAFRGEILQVPPMYSAVKRQGKKLYELARKGVEVERPPRPVTIHRLEAGAWRSPAEVELRVRCSKGTYIRTLCHDIGQALGCGGTMAELRRTEACGFPLGEAHPLEEVLGAEDPLALLLPVDRYFAGYPPLTLGEREAARLRHGASVPTGAEGTFRVYGPAGEFLALGRGEGGTLTAVKSFFEV